MSCAPQSPTFRVLDGIGGWELLEQQDVVESSHGLQLSLRHRGFELSNKSVYQHVLPGWLALSCRTWYLIHDGTLRSLGPCESGFVTVDIFAPATGSGLCVAPEATEEIVAIAGHGNLLAVAFASGTINVIDCRAHRVVSSEVVVGRPTAVAFDERFHTALLVAIAGDDRQTIVRVDACVPNSQSWEVCINDEVVAIGHVGQELIAVSADGDWSSLWSLSASSGCCCRSCQKGQAKPAVRIGPNRLDSDTLDPQTISARIVGDRFEIGPTGKKQCFNRDGTLFGGALAANEIFERLGWFMSGPIDGGHDNTRWGRVRIDTDTPVGTTVDVYVAITWTNDVPIEAEWVRLAGTDALIPGDPVGRFAHLRVRLLSDGKQTPLVRSARFDINQPRLLHGLPAFYSDDPIAAAFTERLLLLLNTGVDAIDSAIASTDILLRVDEIRGELLPMIASALGEELDHSWTEAQQRAYLRALPKIASLRGTLCGLLSAADAVYGIDLHVLEHGVERPWGRIGTARLDGLRLASASHAAVLVSTTELGSAPLDRSFDPVLGAMTSGAHRVTVAVPWTPDSEVRRNEWRRGVERLIRMWVPAHLDVAIRFSDGRAQLGSRVTLGIDTALRPLPATVLTPTGPHATRLGRSSVVACSVRYTGSPTVLGVRSNVGVTTTLG